MQGYEQKKLARLPWVERFRQSETFGRGSCTTVDEAMTDAELLESLMDHDSFQEAWDFQVMIEQTFWDRQGIAWKPSGE